MEDNQPHTFEVYRYLLTPHGSVQGYLFDDIKTPEEAHEKRRVLMCEALEQLEEKTKKDVVRFWKSTVQDNGSFLFHVQKITTKSIEQEFRKYNVRHEPSAWLAIDTDEMVQTIAVETGLQLTSKSIINRISNHLQSYFSDRGLSLIINPIKKKNCFWDFVKEHNEQIREVVFTISPPNMAGLSRQVVKQLSQLSGNTQSKSTTLKLQAGPRKSLVINKRGSGLIPIVDGVEAGAGNYRFKLLGNRKYTNPDDNIETVIATPIPEAKLMDFDINDPETSIFAKIKHFFRLHLK